MAGRNYAETGSEVWRARTADTAAFSEELGEVIKARAAYPATHRATIARACYETVAQLDRTPLAVGQVAAKLGYNGPGSLTFGMWQAGKRDALTHTKEFVVRRTAAHAAKYAAIAEAEVGHEAPRRLPRARPRGGAIP
jgi:hypothetical protein